MNVYLKLRRAALFVCLSGLAAFYNPTNGQSLDQKKEYQFSSQAKSFIDGFAKKLKGEELNYSCLRDDVSEAMLTRANNGKADIEWETKTGAHRLE